MNSFKEKIKNILPSKVFQIISKLKIKLYYFKQTPNIDLIKKQPVYIFHHIPKCGGTSIRRVLSNWFYVINDYNPGTPNNIKYWNTPKELRKIKPYQCLAGYYEFEKEFLSNRYKGVFDNNRYRVFTFVRDPLQTYISLYYYWKKKNKISPDYTLKKHLEKQQNFIANVFNCNCENYKEVIDKYFFVGVLEELQLSLDIFSKLIKRKTVKIIHINKSERDKQEYLPENFVNWFKEQNQLDYNIYNYCKQKFLNYKIDK